MPCAPQRRAIVELKGALAVAMEGGVTNCSISGEFVDKLTEHLLCVRSPRPAEAAEGRDGKAPSPRSRTSIWIKR